MGPNKQPDIHIIEDEENLEAARQYILDNPSAYLSYDIETDGVIEKKCLIYGIGVCVEEHEAFYLVVRDPEGRRVLSDKAVTNFISSITEAKRLIGYNMIFDILSTKNNFTLDLTDKLYADVILLKHSVDEMRPHGLKETAVKYLGPEADKAQERLKMNVLGKGGRWCKEQKDMYLADTTILGEYCSWDVILTLKLFHLFSDKLKEEGLEDLFYKDEIMPLYKECVIPMKDKGFPVNIPHFKTLQKELSIEIKKREKEIYKEIAHLIEPFETELLQTRYPVNRRGNFSKRYANVIGIELPVNDAGNVVMQKKEMLKLVPKTKDQEDFLHWLLDKEAGDEILRKELVRETREVLFYESEGKKQIFNLSSNDHLAHLFFTILEIPVREYTESGAPCTDAETLEELAGEHPFVDKILEMKKLQKLLSTYVNGILDRHIDGIIYPGFLMFGTTSGRFSSVDPNCQNLPRVKDEESNLSPLVLKYTNEIKKGFIAGDGNKICNADYSQLEACAFAAASGDPKLQKIFHDKHDLYSAIAIEAEKVFEFSANKKAPNYLKTHRPELRQKYKVVALAAVYGSGAHRMSEILKVDTKEAQQIINNYLDAYPGLKTYMKTKDYEVTSKGKVSTKFGRIRHLQAAKELYKQYGNNLLNYRWAKDRGLETQRRELKNYLNLAKNHPIQGLAAHLVNRAMLAIVRQFRKEGIVGYPSAQVHDELCFIVQEQYAERSKQIIKQCMENTTLIEVPLIAEPLIADNWAEAK